MAFVSLFQQLLDAFSDVRDTLAAPLDISDRAGRVLGVVESGTLSGDGRKTVTTAGTRVALATTTPAKWVHITAEADNTGLVVVGLAGTVVAALGTRRGTPLAAGEDIVLPIADLADVGLDVTVSGDGVTYTYGA